MAGSRQWGLAKRFSGVDLSTDNLSTFQGLEVVVSGDSTAYRSLMRDGGRLCYAGCGWIRS